MGSKYTINFARNGLCPFVFQRSTNNLIVALWYLITLVAKYPIIDFEVRRGYIECKKCDADWCNKSPKCSVKVNGEEGAEKDG